MKYGDLPSVGAVEKLVAYSFGRDGVDMSVFRFYKQIKNVYEYIQTQIVKIAEKYGTLKSNGEYSFETEASKNAYKSDMKILFEKDISEELHLDIVEGDFDNCKKPQDKNLWLSVGEIIAIINMAD